MVIKPWSKSFQYLSYIVDVRCLIYMAAYVLNLKTSYSGTDRYFEQQKLKPQSGKAASAGSSDGETDVADGAGASKAGKAAGGTPSSSSSNKEGGGKRPRNRVGKGQSPASAVEKTNAAAPLPPPTSEPSSEEKQAPSHEASTASEPTMSSPPKVFAKSNLQRFSHLGG